jgi:peptidyl-prolyl cis-trans isomerase C
MQAGETCPVPVPSRYGWHVVRVLARADGRTLPFEAVRKSIADYLTEASWRRAVSQYISLLAGRAAIEGIALRAASSPLVQ